MKRIELHIRGISSPIVIHLEEDHTTVDLYPKNGKLKFQRVNESTFIGYDTEKISHIRFVLKTEKPEASQG